MQIVNNFSILFQIGNLFSFIEKISSNSKNIKKGHMNGPNRMRFFLSDCNAYLDNKSPKYEYRHNEDEEDTGPDRRSNILLLLPNSCIKFEKQSKVFLGGLSNFNAYKPTSTFHKIYKLKLPICKKMRDKYELDNNKFIARKSKK